jgi:hypothetical protein
MQDVVQFFKKLFYLKFKNNNIWFIIDDEIL